METIRVYDLELEDAVRYLKDKLRGRETEEDLRYIVTKRIGGRLSHLNRLTKGHDVDIYGKFLHNILSILSENFKKF